MLLSFVSYCLYTWLLISHCVIHAASKATLIIIILTHRDVIPAVPFPCTCFELHILPSFFLHSQEQLAKLHISQSHTVNFSFCFSSSSSGLYRLMRLRSFCLGFFFFAQMQPGLNKGGHIFVFTMIGFATEAVSPTSKTTFNHLQAHIWVNMSSISMI